MNNIIFKLSKIPEYSDHRDWDATTIHSGACWVRAENSQNARLSIHLAGAIATEVEPGMPVRYDPWQNLTFTNCEISQPEFDVPDGVIVTSSSDHIEIPA